MAVKKTTSKAVSKNAPKAKKSKTPEGTEDNPVPKKIGLFDIAKNIISELTPFDWDDIKTEYSPYMINKILSQYKDTLFIAQEMNRYYSLDSEMQYRFLFNSIDKRKRYTPWEKADTSLDTKINLIKEYLGYSTIRAREIIPIVDDLDMWDKIEDSLDKGGAVSKKKRKKSEVIE